MNFYIFRHSETYFSKTDTPYGKSEDTAEILPEGIPVTERLAGHLKNIRFDELFSSPYKRCVQTVEIIGKIIKQKFSFDEKLSEFRNENIQEMVARLENFIKSLEGKNYNNIAICTHGYPIAVLTDLILKGEFDEKNLDNYPNPGVLLIFKEGKLEKIDFNLLEDKGNYH